MKGAIAGITVFIALLATLLTFGWVNVKPTEVAVEVNKVMGKVSEKPRGVGYHFFNRWITDMVTYRIATMAYPSSTLESEKERIYTLELKTNDGQNVMVDLTIIYTLRANEVPMLHQQIGQNYADQIILPLIRSEARLAIGNFSAEEIYQGKLRSTMQESIKIAIQREMGKYPAIQIQDALMRHFSFSQQFEKLIEQKKHAAQQVEINKNLAFAQEEEAKRQEAEARGLKLQAVQKAEGQAQAIKINADAQRYQLEQEAAGKLAIYKAEAEGKRLSAEALGGGQNVVALKFAEMIPPHLQVWGIPVGSQNTSVMDVSGIFKGMLDKRSNS